MNKIFIIFILIFGANAAYAGASDAKVETYFAQPRIDLESRLTDYSTMSDKVRSCSRVMMAGSSDRSYFLRCVREQKLANAATDNVRTRLFFADKDVINSVMPDDRYIYINVVKDGSGQTCYRIIREIDSQRDGFYAAETCEY